MNGDVTEVQASLVSGAFEPLARLKWQASETPGLYLSRFMPSGEGFRVVVFGKDGAGHGLQRMSAPLFSLGR